MRFSNWIALSALISSIILLWSLREIIILIFAGIIISILLCSLIDKIQDVQSMPRFLALVLSLASLIIILGISIAIIIPPFTKEFQQIIVQLPSAASELWGIIVGSIDKISEIIYGDDPKRIWNQDSFLNNFYPLPDGSTLATGLGDGIKKIFGLAGNVGSGFVKIIFVLAVGLMISIQPAAYKESAIFLLPSSYRRRAREILNLCGESISNWMVGLILSSILVAILAGIGLSILGVKLVIANALLAGLLNIIPNLGPVLSTIFPISVALLDEPWKAFAVLVLYVFIQNLESYLITPSIMQQKVKLLPGITLSAQFLFTMIFGPIGLLLSLPLAVIMQVIIREALVKDYLNTNQSLNPNVN